MNEGFTDLCKRLEHYETPEWAAEAILRKEPMCGLVVDPCCGIGILRSDIKFDVHDWGIPGLNKQDFLKIADLKIKDDFSIFMNPPFSKACEFVQKSLELGARKIVCFQRFAWWESRSRRVFWEKYPPSRVYVCGDRAPCWRHDIPESERKSGTPTAHAWFVWDRESPPGTLLSHIWKDTAP